MIVLLWQGRWSNFFELLLQEVAEVALGLLTAIP
jgi:hypothetical protein